jgi:FemAB-related protein (PEP-CTERM system-associated)
MPLTLDRIGRKDLDEPLRTAAWDAYCTRHPAATPYHLWAWGRAVASVLSHEPYGLYVHDGGAITGVLPLFLRRSRWFGTNLVSIPAANVGGPLASDERSYELLIDGAIALARELDVDFLEVRDVPDDSPIASRLTLDRDRYKTVTIELADGEAALWAGLSKGIRRRVRRAREAELTVTLQNDVATFYSVYAGTVKRLGSPPFGRDFFDALMARFGENLEIGIARLDGVPVAVDLMLTFCGVRYSVFAGSRADRWDLYPNQLLLWEEIRDACARRERRFDLGRSLVGSGSLEFKLAWGGRVVPLTYGYHLHRARSVPVRTPDTPLYRALGAVWSRLPDGLVETVGPRVVKHLF